MLLTDFPNPIVIDDIIRKFPENTCGSVSAGIVFEKLGLPYAPLFFVSKGRDGSPTKDYPISGSSVIGTALAIASTDLVEVEVYVDFDIEKEYDTLDDCEKPIADELMLLTNVTFYASVDLDVIVAKISDECIPILAFYRDGLEENGHFSPLRGLNGGEIVLLPLPDAIGSCNCDKDEFISSWWKHRICILVKKRIKPTSKITG